MIKHIVWLLGVIAAGMAIVTNVIVMAQFDYLQDSVMDMQKEVLEIEGELLITKNEVDAIANNYGELQAQVQWGLAERYDIKEN